MTIDIERWGRDHWSTLLYIEDICTNGDGEPVSERMRQWPGRPRRGKCRLPWTPPCKGYPTRLNDGTEVTEHDDFDCVDDMVCAGLVEWHGTGLRPVLTLTELGWAMASALRRHVATVKPRSTDAFDFNRILRQSGNRNG